MEYNNGIFNNVCKILSAIMAGGVLPSSESVSARRGMFLNVSDYGSVRQLTGLCGGDRGYCGQCLDIAPSVTVTPNSQTEARSVYQSPTGKVGYLIPVVSNAARL